MRHPTRLLLLALLIALAMPAGAQAGSRTDAWLVASVSSPEETASAQAEPAPIHMDTDLAREHERFTQFAREQVARMNATILGGRNGMQVARGADGLFHARYKAIDAAAVVCQVRRSESNPQFYVGNLIYKELVLESVAQSAEACRKGPFEPVSEKPNRVIYTSKPGGGWQ